MLKKYEKKLLDELSKSDFLTAAQLAQIIHVSTRSIKNYIKSLNAQYPNIIQSSYKGYLLNKEIFNHVQEETNDHLPQTTKERISYILNLLISNDEDFVLDLNDLCDELYISMSTLKNDLKRVKGIVSKYDLYLDATSTTISLKGNETNRRKLLSSLLQDESDNSFLNINFLQETFHDIDMNDIKSSILSVFKKNHYFINDYSLQSLVIHTTIAIDRIKNGYCSSKNINSQFHFDIPEYDIAKELFKILGKKYSLIYSNDEIYDLALMISSRATSIDFHEVDITNIREFIGENCYNLVTFLIAEMNRLYYIDLSENEFFVRFALHIHNLLIRSNHHNFCKNPLAKSIKKTCPLIFDMSVTIANLINKQENIHINDDEIGYIAFHLGSTIEMKKKHADKISAVLFSQNYYDMSFQLSRKINDYFKDRLIITNLINNEEDLIKNRKNDLVITTIPLPYEFYTLFPIVNINVFPSSQDLNNIETQLNQIEHNKKKKIFEENLLKITSKQLFDASHHFDHKDDCINFICNELQQSGYVDSSFKNEIYERENLSSTAYGTFAIPHTIKMNAKKTGMYVLISKNAINWDDNKVYIVLLMCFCATERKIFNDTFSTLADILSNQNCLQKLYQCTNYEDFIKIISNYA